MDTAQFRLPVRIARVDRDAIDEIYSAEEALDMLLAWPDRSGRVYDQALKACFAATVDVASADEAQRAFTAFTRLNGILAKDMQYSRPSRRKGDAGASSRRDTGTSVA